MISNNMEANIQNAENLIRQAAKKGANIILIQELFETLYFCQVIIIFYNQDQIPKNFDYSYPVESHPVMPRMIALAKELKVVLPVSLFEKCGQAHFNTMVVS